MTRVFIGGSRHLSRLNDEIALRLDNVVRSDLSVIIGDAAGFDLLAQAFFAARKYLNVTVYATHGQCRNNAGRWPVRSVPFAGSSRGLEFYTAKDDAMLADADYGLFAWDGKSRGTLRNIARMAEVGKPSLVFLPGVESGVTVRNTQELQALTEPQHAADRPSPLFTDAWRATA